MSQSINIKFFVIKKSIIKKVGMWWIAGLFIIYCQAQPLDSILKLAYTHNPELRGLQLEYESALQKGKQVVQLPNPRIVVGLPVLQPETRLGAQVLTISASQFFPWFGTQKAKEDIAITMAKSKYERIAAARLNIDFQIKTAYYNLHLAEETQAIIRKNIRLFETLEKVALTNLESGKTIAFDVLKLRIKIEELVKQIQLLEYQKQHFISTINEMLNNPQETAIHTNIAQLSLAEFAFDVKQHKQKIESNHPLLKQIDWHIATSNKKLNLNALEGKPGFGLGLDYSLVKERSDASPKNNGRDILIPKVMVSLPIYRKKYGAKRQEEKLKIQGYHLEKEQLTNAMLGNIQHYKAEYESAKLKHELAAKQLEISKSAYKILLARYSSEADRFDELIKLQSAINSYEIDSIKAVIQSHLVKFKIDRLTDY